MLRATEVPPEYLYYGIPTPWLQVRAIACSLPCTVWQACVHARTRTHTHCGIFHAQRQNASAHKRIHNVCIHWNTLTYRTHKHKLTHTNTHIFSAQTFEGAHSLQHPVLPQEGLNNPCCHAMVARAEHCYSTQCFHLPHMLNS